MTEQRSLPCVSDAALDPALQWADHTDITSPEDLEAVAARYAVRSTPFLDRLLAQAPPDDPIARQFRPDAAELFQASDDLLDPIGDAAKSPLPGIVHRYADRVLLKPIHACAAYCRFCFRREQVGPGGDSLSDDELEQALDYIRQTPAIWEVVLTGGDPLLLSARRLRRIIAALEDIPHVEVLRIHTRLPLHDPQRINAEMIEALAGPERQLEKLSVWIAVHLNHRQELMPDVVSSLQRLQRAGLPLISQTVLLKGVNDTPEALCDLFRALVRHGVKPYYLHHPDPAPGTSHFRLTIAEGRKIVREVHARLSGIARPTYVLDRPEGAGKVHITLYTEA